MHNRKKLIVGLKNWVFLWVSVVPLLWTSFDSSDEGIDNRLVTNALC